VLKQEYYKIFITNFVPGYSTPIFQKKGNSNSAINPHCLGDYTMVLEKKGRGGGGLLSLLLPTIWVKKSGKKNPDSKK
jgi:hypothetical protein